MVKIGLISAGMVSAFLVELLCSPGPFGVSSLVLLKALTNEYGDSHFEKPYISTEKADHWSSSLENEADYLTDETWKNCSYFTSKSLKIIPNSFGKRLEASCKCAHNHYNHCSTCQDISWDYETVFHEYDSHSLSLSFSEVPSSSSSLSFSSASTHSSFSVVLSLALSLIAWSSFLSSAIPRSSWIELYFSSISFSFGAIKASRSGPSEVFIPLLQFTRVTSSSPGETSLPVTSLF